MNEYELLNIAQWIPASNNPAGSRCYQSISNQQKPTFDNPTNGKARFTFNRIFSPDKRQAAQVAGIKLTVKATSEFGTGCLVVNNISLPLNSESWLPRESSTDLSFYFECSANSRIVLEQVTMEWCEQPQDLTLGLSDKPNVLVVTPEYPSEANLYLCAFAHARNRRYLEKGLDIQVISMDPYCKHQTRYKIDEIPVLVGGIPDFEKLLLRKQYKVIITHFVDAHHYRIFDACVTNERLIFICHGPLETLFPMSPVIARPYFTPEPDYIIPDNAKINQVRRYARKDNVDWIFVSNWQLEKSQELMGVEFLNAHVIHNAIDSRRFPYKKKSAEDRKHILVLRRFENTCFHSIDIVIRCILELSTREFFEDLHFEIVGDGSMFDTLTAPVRDLPNVELRQQFIPNEKIHQLHARNGIALVPSRHDSHPVSMGEAASSGLAVVGSRVTSVPYFMEETINRTLADPEDPIELADIIERLYRNPDEFLEISQRMSQRMRELCNVEQTTDAEVALVKKRLSCANTSWTVDSAPHDASDPMLTIALIGKADKTIGKCLNTLVNHANAGMLEILIYPKPTEDNILRIVRAFEVGCPATIRLLDDGTCKTLESVIDKCNGRYVRFQDTSSWVESSGLSLLIERLHDADTDLVLTTGTRLKRTSPEASTIGNFPSLKDRAVYKFDFLTYPSYGFAEELPGVSTSTYRLSFLKKCKPLLNQASALSFYTLELASIACAQTVSFEDLIVSCVFDTSSEKNGWLFERQASLVHFMKSLTPASESKTRRHGYLVERVLATEAQDEIMSFNEMCCWNKIDDIIQASATVPGMYDAIARRAQSMPALAEVLARYPKALARKEQKPIISDNGIINPHLRSTSELAHDIIRNAIPFGVIEKRREILDERKKERRSGEEA